MNGSETRQAIADSLAGFATKPLAEAAAGFFAALGYHSERRLEFPTLSAFFSEFDHDGKAAKHFPEVGPAEPGKAVLIQQLTSEEIEANSSGQFALARSTKADLRQIADSYLFLTISVDEGDCTRTTLANRARALNGLFKQPVLVLFRHGTCISLAITYRRTSKRDQSRDVIERKVTFIKDIFCRQPHPGHLAILEDFSLPALSNARQRDIRNFAELDDAWRESLSSQLLNRQFYDEIANWYFWARDHWTNGPMKLPSAIKSEEDASLFLIRLLTRLIFCWFLKEKTNPQTGKGLIPEEFFDPHRIRELLRDSSPNAGTYYTAILQNLFFATLNTEMDGTRGRTNRRFIDAGGGKSNDHMVHQLWRNDKLLADVNGFEQLARRVPFLNGGLFECLDERIQNGNSSSTTEVRVDGFSSNPNKQPKLPNILFFGRDHDESFIYNLSNAYGDSSRSRVTVRPLLEIFRRFKFTLTENTPIEEEVALDPELLGHVFENLLASYNPETGTIARKATGSFYTPRVVVDWMVDEALIVHFESVLQSAIHRPEKPFESRLRGLLAWDGLEHEFDQREVEVLIDAIHSLKALNPACGSGAFPMGLLQKLVLILRKLDHGNEQWKSRQIAAAETIESPPMRAEALRAIERAFARDNDDYGRKLYLIENCLYGVDIQPVAVQIAKLRFFIALVVDQKISPSEENYGILALPNLETKIVAANTLMGLKRGQLLLGSNRVRHLERKLQQVRHDYFTARRYEDKKTLRGQDRELCRELADALAESGECTTYDAKRLAEWNPYKTNTSAPFFDPGWMFGLAAGRKRDAASSRTTLRGNFGLINQVAGQMEIDAPAEDSANAGFDILIGNPPYVRQEELKSVIVQDSAGENRPLKEALKDQYECFTGTADLYVYFFERSFQLLRNGGVLSFITSNKYFQAAYGERLRTFILFATQPRILLDFGDSPVFTAVAYPCIFVAQKVRHVNKRDLPDPDKFKLADHLKQLLPQPDRTFRVMTWTSGPPLRDFPLIFDEQAFPLAQRELRPDGWRLGGRTGLRLLDRLRSAGTPLGTFVADYFFRGVTTGLNKVFILDNKQMHDLVAEHRSSREVIKPFLRGKHVKRWQVEAPTSWLLFIPWHFPLHNEAGITGASKTAEKAFANGYPAVYEYLRRFKPQLENRNQEETGIRYEWYALQRWGAEFAQEFSRTKIVYPELALEPSFAFDENGVWVDCTLYFIPNSHRWLLGILNSSVSRYIFDNISPAMRGGFRRFKAIYMQQIPIPAATPEQKQWCDRLAAGLIWLHRSDVALIAGGVPLSLMSAYFEQWLNGLIYELFFADELHARNLRLFDETAKLDFPALDILSDGQKLSRLKGIFEEAYDTNAAIRSMLYSLRSLEVVRIIEESVHQAKPIAAEKTK